MAKFPNWAVGTDGSATNLAYMVPNIVTKASANTITSNTTLANDSELTNLSLTAGTWEIEVMLWATGTAASTGGLKTAWAFATGTLTGTPNRACLGPGSGGAATSITMVQLTGAVVAYTTSVSYGLTNTALPYYLIKEECPNFVVATTGTLSVQVAQIVSNATSTVVQPGSRVKYRQIA
jgi:hypothetical protein